MFRLIYQHVCNVIFFGEKVRFLLSVNAIVLVRFFVQYRKFNLCEINVRKKRSFCDRSCKICPNCLTAFI